MRTVSTNQAQKETIIMENFRAMQPAECFGFRVQGTTGLVYGYWGGKFPDGSGVLQTIAPSTVTLTANATNYVYLNQTTMTVSVSLTVPTLATQIRLAKITTNATDIVPGTGYEDERAFAMLGVGVVPSAGSGGGGGGATLDYYNDVRKLRAYYWPILGGTTNSKMGNWTGTFTALSDTTDYGATQGKWGSMQKAGLTTTAVANAFKSFYLTGGGVNHQFRREANTTNVFVINIGAPPTGLSLANAGLVVMFSSQSFVANPFNSTADFSGIATSTNFFGVGMRATDTNLQIIYRPTNLGALVFVDLGIDFPRPVAGGNIGYEIKIESIKSTTQIKFTVKHLQTLTTYTNTFTCFTSSLLTLTPSVGVITNDAVIKELEVGDMAFYQWVD